jgi:hypothetical protein
VVNIHDCLEYVSIPLRTLSWLPFPRHTQLIRELYTVTEASASSDDQSQKGTQLLEIYALEIQMHNETKNYKKLKVSAWFFTSTKWTERHNPESLGNLQRVH